MYLMLTLVIVGHIRLTLTHFMEQDPGTKADNARLAKLFVTFHETRMLFIIEE